MDTEPMEPTPTLTTERGPLMLSLRLMLRPILLSSMAPMDIPMPVSTVDTEPMEPTPIHTTARGPLMLRLTLPSSTTPMDMGSPMLVSMLVSPLDPALVLTPSPRDLMLPPRDLPHTTDMPDMAGESKSFSRECNCQTNYYL